MLNSQKSGVFEQFIQAIKLICFPKPKAIKVDGKKDEGAPCDSRAVDVSSTLIDGNSNKNGALRLSLQANTDETLVEESVQGNNTNQHQQDHNAQHMSQDVFSTVGFDSTRQNEVLSFLDDVIAGKHETLLKEMNQVGSPNENDTKNYDGVSHSTRAHEDLDTFFVREVSPPLYNSLLKQNKKVEQQTSGHMSINSEIPSTRRTYSCAASSAARSLKDYELIAYLGKGTFAEVTLARHKVTSKLFALKKISKWKVREEGFVQNTFTERQLLELFAHPFLVKLHQAFQSCTHLYLVLDFAQGGDMYFFLESKPWVRDMRRRLQREKRFCPSCETTDLITSRDHDEYDVPVNYSTTIMTQLPFSTVNEMVTQMAPDDSHAPIRLVAFYAIELALVLEYLHEHGFVYRDLKPENVLMMRDGHVVLTDFGVATYRGADKTQTMHNDGTKRFTGTTQYMSPEMLLGQQHDHRIDWWSFGCLLFEMATGRRPFQSNSQYGVFRAIVESDVEIRPDDFLLMELEVETRVVQLQNLYQRFTHKVLQRIAQCKLNENMSEEKGMPLCFNASEERPSRLKSLFPEPTDNVSVGDCDAEGEIKQTSVNDASICMNGDILSSWSSISTEDYALFTRYAVEEMNEACRLLKDLILSLLERRMERRLSGKEVLNHPFFSCAYVVSQLYDGRPLTQFCYESSGACTPTSASGVIGLNSPHTSSVSTLLFPSVTHQNVSPLSCRTVFEKTMDNTTFVDDTNGVDDDDDLISAIMDVTELQKCLSVSFFLNVPPLQRPTNWRELFLEGKIQPPYIPRLLASDDLRYFPSAVTAMGDSVLSQQRVLRMQCDLSDEEDLEMAREFMLNKQKSTRSQEGTSLEEVDFCISSQQKDVINSSSYCNFEAFVSKLSIPSPRAVIWHCNTVTSDSITQRHTSGSAESQRCTPRATLMDTSFLSAVTTTKTDEVITSEEHVTRLDFLQATANDNEEGTYKTNLRPPFVLPLTLHGIAYDVDDYVPSTSKRRGLVLKSHTGIPQQGPSECLSERGGWQSAQQTSDVNMLGDIEHTAVFTPRLSKLKPQSFLSVSEITTLPVPLWEEDDTNGCNIAKCPQRLSPLSLATPKEDGATTAPKSPADVRDFMKPDRTLPSFGTEEESVTTTDGVEESVVSQNCGESLLMGRGGGVHHYLGFTYNEQNGNALLLGADFSGADSSKWRFE